MRWLARSMPLWLVFAGCGPSVPTLPLPPPSALSSAPDDMGFVTVTGDGASEGALVAVYNEITTRGVIEPAETDGTFSIEIEAQSGDSLLVWQSAGSETSAAITLLVPE